MSLFLCYLVFHWNNFVKKKVLSKVGDSEKRYKVSVGHVAGLTMGVWNLLHTMITWITLKYLGHHIELAGTKDVTEYKMLMPYQQILRKNFSPGNEENIKKKMMTTHSQFLSKQNLVKSLSLSTECKQPWKCPQSITFSQRKIYPKFPVQKKKKT